MKETEQEVDSASKEVVAEILRRMGFEEVVIDRRKTACIDIRALYPGVGRLAVEVKERDCPSTMYPDMACEELKYRVVAAGIIAGTYVGGMLVSVYSDGVVGIGNIMAGHKVEGIGPKSTTWDRVTVHKNWWDVPFANRMEIPPDLLSLL